MDVEIENELTDHARTAIALALAGTPVFPCSSNKKPLTDRGFKDATTDADRARAWWHQYPYALPAVPTGEPSRLFVLDVDRKEGKDGFATLSALGVELPDTRRHQTQSGGAHFLFAQPKSLSLKCSVEKLGAGLDVRADGGYIVWWPAIGLSVENAANILPIPQWLLDAATPLDPSGRTDLQKKQMTQQSYSVSSVSSVGDTITRYLPDNIGQRNKRLFELARHLKGLMPGASKTQLREIVTEWHRRALSNIGTAGFAESWGDFQRGWDACHTPYGSVLSRIIGEIDMTEAAPESLLSLGYNDKELLLCKICKQLQTHAGDEPFFLSARQAGALAGLHYTDAAKVLYAMVADDVLVLLRKGAGKVASRYHYIWPD